MTVKHTVEDVAAGNSLIQDAEKLGSDIAGDTGVPRGIEPKCSFLPAPVSSLFICAVSVVQ